MVHKNIYIPFNRNQLVILARTANTLQSINKKSQETVKQLCYF